MAANTTKNNRKTALLIGGAAAGLTGLYLLTRNSGSSSTQQGEETFWGGGGFTGGGYTDGTAIGEPVAEPLFDIDAFLKQIDEQNQLARDQQQRQWQEYLKQLQPATPTTEPQVITPTPYGGGSAGDEGADIVSNPGGSATKLSDLERALQGYDLDKDDLNAMYPSDTAKFTFDEVYQLLPGGGIGVAGGASNAMQPTGKDVVVTRTKDGFIEVSGPGISGTQRYTSTGQLITTPTKSSGGGGGGGGSTGKNPTTTTGQGGGTQPTPTTTKPSTSPTPGSVIGTISNITPVGAATGGAFGRAVSTVVDTISNAIGSLFK